MTQSNQLIWVQALLADIINQENNPAVVGPGKLSGAKVALYSNALTPTNTNTFADLVECLYTGYAESIVIVWDANLNETDDTLTAWSAAYLFRQTASPTDDTCMGIAVTDGVASPSQGLLMLANLPVPYQFNAVGNGFTAQVGFNMGQSTPNCEFVVNT